MEIYLVGGAVRDQLLGLPVAEKDWLVVGATPEDMRRLGYRQVGRDFPVFLHPQTHDEYALARTERKVAPGHQGFVCHTGPDVTLEEDLRRRDLTVNAIAQDSSGKLIDPWGGLRDLEKRCLCHVSEAFAEDPLRVFRVARLAAKLQPLGFQVSSNTMQLMQQIHASGELMQLSAERVWQELKKALATAAPWQFFVVLENSGCLASWFPELTGHMKALEGLLHRIGAGHVPNSALLRYLSIGWLLDPDVMDALSKRLKAPKEFREMSLQIARHGQDLSEWKTLPPGALLASIAGLGGLRRQQQQRFATLLEVISGCSHTSLEDLQQLVERLRCLGPDDLPQTLAGAEIGTALEQLRRQILQQAAG